MCDVCAVCMRCLYLMCGAMLHVWRSEDNLAYCPHLPACFRGGLLCFLPSTPDEPAPELLGPSCLCPPFCHRSTGTIDTWSLPFTCIWEFRTQGLKLVQGMPYPLSHLPSLRKHLEITGRRVKVALRPNNGGARIVLKGRSPILESFVKLVDVKRDKEERNWSCSMDCGHR